MKNRFQTTLMATALLALGLVAAVPARAGIGAKKVTSYIEAARSVFGGDKTAAEVVAETAKNKATAGEIAAAVGLKNVRTARIAEMTKNHLRTLIVNRLIEA